MPRLKPHKFLDLIKILKKHDSKFEVHTERGKGSHRMIYHPNVGGKPASFPIICHKKNQEIDKNTISDLIRRFDLPKGVL